MIPDHNGGFWLMADTCNHRGPKLSPGDLVAWEPVEYRGDLAAEMAKSGGDKRMGWMGFIVAKLQPIYSEGSWLLGERFR